MNGKMIIEISNASLLKFFLSFLFLFLIYFLKDILLWFLFALVIAILLSPVIDFFSRKIPRGLSVIIVYLFLIIFISYFLNLLTSPFLKDLKEFSRSLPLYLKEISPFLENLPLKEKIGWERLISFLEKNLAEISKNIFKLTTTFFGGLFSFFTILFLAILISLEEKGLERAISLIFPKKYDHYALKIFRNYRKKVSGWFGVRILGCFLVGFLTYFLLKAFKINYALSLALFGGISNFVPIIGPIICGIFIAFISFFSSPLKAFLIVLFFILIQQIENLLTPLLAKKFIHLPSSLILLSLLAGGKLFGILGAILSIPIFAIFYELIKDYLEKRRSF